MQHVSEFPGIRYAMGLDVSLNGNKLSDLLTSIYQPTNRLCIFFS